MIAPVFEAAGIRVFQGDCIEVMRQLPAESVHAVVTDPPYGIGFMGHDWDQPGREVPAEREGVPSGHRRRSHPTTPTSRGWGGEGAGAKEAGRYDLSRTANQIFAAWVADWAAECLRLLKPGGHMLVSGSPRTWHRLAVGIEDAGFEIRDSIAWLYGSGFPKSLDVAQAIDKRRDDVEDVRVVCRWLRAQIDSHPRMTVGIIGGIFGFHPRMVEHWAARDTDSQPTLPTLEQWDKLRELLGFDDAMDAEVYRLNLRKGEPGEAWADRDVVGTVEAWENRTNYALTSRDRLRRGSTKNPEAAAWQGWGTALKPAFEPIVVARKPLVGTVAANVLAHRTGALNIDGTRIAHADAADLAASLAKNPGRDDTVTSDVYGAGRPQQKVNVDGRWPTNVTLDPSQAAELDAQEREKPARFFPTFRYEAKAPTEERPVVDGVQHPTVKPLDLMRWLVRLVTPDGDVVLEPFAGSGTTAEACVREGFDCIAIERDETYLPLIVQRLSKDHQQSLFGDWETTS